MSDMWSMAVVDRQSSKKKLYIFDIVKCVMFTFNGGFASVTVIRVKKEIERIYEIISTDQILMTGDGDILKPTDTINSYATGTDTNPVYLINKNLGSITGGFTKTLEPKSVKDIEQQWVRMPDTYSNLVSRTDRSCHLLHKSYEILEECEGLIKDQELQRKGWTGIVAYLRNHEDNKTLKNCDFSTYNKMAKICADIIDQLKYVILVQDGIVKYFQEERNVISKETAMHVPKSELEAALDDSTSAYELEQKRKSHNGTMLTTETIGWLVLTKRLKIRNIKIKMSNSFKLRLRRIIKLLENPRY